MAVGDGVKKPKKKPRTKPKKNALMVPDIEKVNGRPTKYKPSHDEWAFKYALLGLTDEQMAKLFQVDVSTFDNWKARYPSFLGSLKAGKEDADAVIANSLYHKAKGYQEEKVRREVCPLTGVVLKEHRELISYAPDVTAMIYWLNNRQHFGWKGRRDEVEQEKLALAKEKLAFEQEMERKRLEIELAKLELAKLKATLGEGEEVEDDGFIAALSEEAQEVWADEVEDESV